MQPMRSIVSVNHTVYTVTHNASLRGVKSRAREPLGSGRHGPFCGSPLSMLIHLAILDSEMNMKWNILRVSKT